MKQELVRMNSIDGIEMVGILYEPEEKSNTIVIHVHGLCGNFYENRFLDILAKTYTNKGISFLTFNNRGTNFISELLKGNEFEIIGGCYEKFIDCLLDIEGAINYDKEKGYKDIIIEGHISSNENASLEYGKDDILILYNKKEAEDLSYKRCESVYLNMKTTDLYKFTNYALQDLLNIYTNDEENRRVDFILIENSNDMNIYTNYINNLRMSNN